MCDRTPGTPTPIYYSDPDTNPLPPSINRPQSILNAGRPQNSNLNQAFTPRNALQMDYPFSAPAGRISYGRPDPRPIPFDPYNIIQLDSSSPVYPDPSQQPRNFRQSPMISVPVLNRNMGNVIEQGRMNASFDSDEGIDVAAAFMADRAPGAGNPGAGNISTTAYADRFLREMYPDIFSTAEPIARDNATPPGNPAIQNNLDRQSPMISAPVLNGNMESIFQDPRTNRYALSLLLAQPPSPERPFVYTGSNQAGWQALVDRNNAITPPGNPAIQNNLDRQSPMISAPVLNENMESIFQDPRTNRYALSLLLAQPPSPERPFVYTGSNPAAIRACNTRGNAAPPGNPAIQNNLDRQSPMISAPVLNGNMESIFQDPRTNRYALSLLLAQPPSPDRPFVYTGSNPDAIRAFNTRGNARPPGNPAIQSNLRRPAPMIRRPVLNRNMGNTRGNARPPWNSSIQSNLRRPSPMISRPVLIRNMGNIIQQPRQNRYANLLNEPAPPDTNFAIAGPSCAIRDVSADQNGSQYTGRLPIYEPPIQSVFETSIPSPNTYRELPPLPISPHERLPDFQDSQVSYRTTPPPPNLSVIQELPYIPSPFRYGTPAQRQPGVSSFTSTPYNPGQQPNRQYVSLNGQNPNMVVDVDQWREPPEMNGVCDNVSFTDDYAPIPAPALMYGTPVPRQTGVSSFTSGTYNPRQQAIRQNVSMSCQNPNTVVNTDQWRQPPNFGSGIGQNPSANVSYYPEVNGGGNNDVCMPIPTDFMCGTVDPSQPAAPIFFSEAQQNALRRRSDRIIHSPSAVNRVSREQPPVPPSSLQTSGEAGYENMGFASINGYINMPSNCCQSPPAATTCGYQNIPTAATSGYHNTPTGTPPAPTSPVVYYGPQNLLPMFRSLPSPPLGYPNDGLIISEPKVSSPVPCPRVLTRFQGNISRILPGTPPFQWPQGTYGLAPRNVSPGGNPNQSFGTDCNRNLQQPEFRGNILGYPIRLLNLANAIPPEQNVPDTDGITYIFSQLINARLPEILGRLFHQGCLPFRSCTCPEGGPAAITSGSQNPSRVEDVGGGGAFVSVEFGGTDETGTKDGRPPSTTDPNNTYLSDGSTVNSRSS